MRQQTSMRPKVTLEKVRDCLDSLVLPDTTIEIAALAAASGRSLFLFGPAGNGKTSLGRLLHNTTPGHIWVPYCLSIGQEIIRIHDPQTHRSKSDVEPPKGHDPRWTYVQRPMIVAGGEMTLDELDLSYSTAQRFYEAPPHLKANGGTFLIDDFGRQRMEPHELLNRWIVPLENRIDYLNLRTGHKLVVPFDVMLIVATNLRVQDVADPAFLRRMGYRLHINRPDEKAYREIFHRYAQGCQMQVNEGRLDQILKRYETEGRELRASEPRDLIQRAIDICSLRDVPLEMTEPVLDLAWEGYFGNTPVD